MNVPAKLAVYGLGLVVAFTGAFGAGRWLGPVAPASAAPDHAAAPEETPGGYPVDADVPAGLRISADGYTLDPVDAPEEAGERADLVFRVLGPDGAPVTDFAGSHEKRMHLIVAARDLGGYQHLHPEMAEDGTWSVPLELAEPGPYRMFADFVPDGGTGTTLGADIAVPGEYRPRPLPEESRTAEVDGYTVELAGGLVPGTTSELAFTVREAESGTPVTDLQPYLAAYGHLVALRDGDLGFLHVHPEGEPGDGATPSGPEIGFAAEVPSAGTYRLYLDFRHDGEVRTAEFTVTAAGDGEPAPAPGSGGTGHGH
ncbi:hypothetical protein [Marinitenerispora sediminis]|uniref:Heavy metal-binding domain-containing protein n=1 Tax=Marinitenerispora sediminis TaxID=1931232 RepID=A0A368T4G0_9ACTN|nr:hypothetical protein [Marinitenerispora sediminis]RCV50158.1 hypothetical protein DEF28_18795 [Marinitenerispora sediminis]RCV50314.1 hypothetical protein DEF23_22250 [Marinitenerispora sediminis]RCV57711.1 hypothetical protein DEF24_14765 [Marinitenerispora sediminis]